MNTNKLDSSLRPELQRLLPMFQSLSDNNSAGIDASALNHALLISGLSRLDPRLKHVFQALDACDGVLSLEQFSEVISSSTILIERALRGHLIIPDVQIFSQHMASIFDAVKQNTAGKQASYIPPLADVNPDQLGLAIVSIDGQSFSQPILTGRGGRWGRYDRLQS
jgi:glutaminase